MNKEKIKILTSSNKILFKYSCINNSKKITLEKAILYNADLDNADLHNADLRNANLNNANLSNAILYNADLRNVILYNADLRNADLHNADLNNADLRNADLRNADLYNADLRNVDLRNAILHNANLSNAILYNADLRNADLYNADLRNADLRNAILHNAILPKQFKSNLNILKIQKNKLYAYKYLNKDMISPYQNFKYEIGKEYISKDVNNNETILCGSGINIATLQWCLQDTNYDLKNKIYVQIEFDPKDLIIPYNSNGKFRIKKDGIVKFIKILTEKEIKEIINL